MFQTVFKGFPTHRNGLRVIVFCVATVFARRCARVVSERDARTLDRVFAGARREMNRASYDMGFHSSLIGRRMPCPHMSTQNDPNSTDRLEIEALIARHEAGTLSESDTCLTGCPLRLIVKLLNFVEQKSPSIKRLKRLLFRPDSNSRTLSQIVAIVKQLSHWFTVSRFMCQSRLVQANWSPLSLTTQIIPCPNSPTFEIINKDLGNI